MTVTSREWLLKPISKALIRHRERFTEKCYKAQEKNVLESHGDIKGKKKQCLEKINSYKEL